MKNIKKGRIIALCLAVIMAVSAVGFVPVSATVERDLQFASEHPIVVQIDNTSFNPHVSGSGGIVTRQLIRHTDGSLEELNAGQSSFTASRYDHSGNLIFTREVHFELPLFGAFFSGANYNFAVFGQSNIEESPSVEVFRIVRYDRQWNRIDDLRLFGGVYGQFGEHGYGNVTRPFAFGTPRFAEYRDLLVLQTPRVGYQGRYMPDGTGAAHQSSLFIFVHTPTMSFYPQARLPWASHAYNQFPLFDNGQPVFLNHVCEFPRGISIWRGRELEYRYYYLRPNGTRYMLGNYNWSELNYIYTWHYFIRHDGYRHGLGRFPGGEFWYWYNDDFHILPPQYARFEERQVHTIENRQWVYDYTAMFISGGHEYTGVSVGGFGMSRQNYIAAVNVTPNLNSANSRQRNIYTLVTPRDFTPTYYSVVNARSRKVPIATFAGTNTIASAPIMSQTGFDSFALMWEEYDLNSLQSRGFVLQYINGNGQAIGSPLRFDSKNAMLAEVLMMDWFARETPTSSTPDEYIPPQTTPPTTTVSRTLRFAIGNTTFTDNGTPRTLEAAPFIQNDRTMVPLRVIVEALGATNLNFNAGVISFTLDGRTITMTIGQPLPNNMGTPVIVADRTFVPLAYIVNEMGAVARWDNATRSAYIYID